MGHGKVQRVAPRALFPPWFVLRTPIRWSKPPPGAGGPWPRQGPVSLLSPAKAVWERTFTEIRVLTNGSGSSFWMKGGQGASWTHGLGFCVRVGCGACRLGGGMLPSPWLCVTLAGWMPTSLGCRRLNSNATSAEKSSGPTPPLVCRPPSTAHSLGTCPFVPSCSDARRPPSNHDLREVGDAMLPSPGTEGVLAGGRHPANMEPTCRVLCGCESHLPGASTRLLSGCVTEGSVWTGVGFGVDKLI